MQNALTIERKVGGGFVLDEASIRRLVEFLHKKMNLPLSLSMTLSDSTTIICPSIDALLSDNHIERGYIDAFKIESLYSDLKLIISFDVNRNIPIRLYVSGDRDRSKSIYNEIIEEIDSIRMWYSPFILSQYEVSLYSGLSFVFTFSSTLFILFYKFYDLIMNQVGTLFFLCMMTLSAILDPINRFLFPPLIVNIGRSSIKYNNKNRLINFVLLSVIVSILVNIFSNYVYDRIK